MSSDSLAAWLAVELGAERLILVNSGPCPCHAAADTLAMVRDGLLVLGAGPRATQDTSDGGAQSTGQQGGQELEPDHRRDGVGFARFEGERQ